MICTIEETADGGGDGQRGACRSPPELEERPDKAAMSHVTHKLYDGSLWCQTHGRHLETCKAVEIERRACAEVAAAYASRNYIGQFDYRARAEEAKAIATAIRARTD